MADPDQDFTLTSRAAAHARSALALAALALLIYLVLGGVLLQSAFFGDDVVSPAAFWAQNGPFPAAARARVAPGLNLLSDNVSQFTPWLRFAADAFEQDGRLPLWKSLACCGAPFVGNGQSSLFFPTTLAAILLGAPPWIGAAQSLFRLAAGALCAYLLGRHLRCSFLAALLTGLVFGFGGFQVMWLQHPHTQVSLLLPLLLLAADRAVLSPTAGRIALLATVAGLQHLGGHPETTVHCQLVALALGGARVWSLRRHVAGGTRATSARRCLALLSGLALGGALGAVQILPLLEYIRESDSLMLRARSAQDAAPVQLYALLSFLGTLLFALLCAWHVARGRRRLWLSATGLALAVFTGLLVGLQGGLSPTWISLLAADWFGPARHCLGPANYVEQNGAFAGVALPLALFGLLAGRPRGAARAATVLLVIGVLALLRAPGVTEGLALLPGLHLAVNTRLSLVALLASAVLAGLGLDALGGAGARTTARVTRPATRPARDTAVTAPNARAAHAALPALRLRYGWLCAALASAGFGALAWGVADGRIQNPNVPDGPEAFAVHPLPITDACRVLEPQLVANIAAQFPPDGEPSKWFAGWFELSGGVSGGRVLYNKTYQSVEALCTPALRGGDSRTPWITPAGEARYVFLSAVPLTEFPPEQSGVRLRLELEDGRVLVSDLLRSPEDPGRTTLPFPAQPASGRAWLQVVLLCLATLLIACAMQARGALRQGARTALVTLCAASLLPFTADMLPLLPRAAFYPGSGALDVLASLGNDSRMLAMNPGNMPAEVPVYYGIRDVRGYDALHPRRSVRLLRQAVDSEPWLASMEALPVRRDIDLRVLGLMAVRCIVDWTDAPDDLAPVPFKGEALLPRWAPFRIVRNPCFLPRARLVTDCVVEADDERAIALLTAPEFPLATTVVLASAAPRTADRAPDTALVTAPDPPHSGAPDASSKQATGSAPDASSGTAFITLDRPDFVHVLVNPTRSAHLLLADTYFPGWTCTVDGQPREIVRANVAFRAVAVEPGERHVEFRYQPLSVRIGAVISVAVTLTLLGMALRGRRKRARRPSPALGLPDGRRARGSSPGNGRPA